ncbi:MAG TPA: response regulator [Chthoniobacterales bacterium]|jgi:DNA-binding response OmpR family regulator
MKLLIVDDEPDLCQLLQEHFEEHFEGDVLTATTPGEALRLLEELQPEGMLLDINLRSRLDGFDVLARASEISPSTKIIMVTGNNDFESVERALMLGAVDYITKPFTVGYLEETVDAKIARHLIYA